MKPKKISKIIIGVIVFLTLPSIIFFGFVYFKYNQDLPNGTEGEQADALANKMLNSLNYEAYNNTNYIEWAFRNRHFYKWKKSKNKCDVYWEEYKVSLDLNDYKKSKAYVHSFKADAKMSEELIKTAIKYFNNDSFWLVAPYKVFDKGTERRLVKLENSEEALLVTYKSGGSTPGDSYLWLFDEQGKPKAFKMWTSILPVKGLEASWSDWTTTESGAQLPLFHKMFIFGLEINHIKGTF